MSEILLYVTNGLIIFSFILYFILILVGRRREITGSDGFNITKDMLDEYDSINIVENKGYFTVYNIKRKVIRIASRCYYGKSVSDIAIPLIEAGISSIDNYKNKTINTFRNIVPNLKCLYILAIIAIFINESTYNISDAKVSIIIIGIFSIINYLIIGIKSEANIWISKRIKHIKTINKNNQEKVLKLINNILLLDKIVFISELIMIIRYVWIIIE